MNLLTKFYVDRRTNVTSKVKNAPPLGSHVFQASIGNKSFTKAIYSIITKNAPPPGGHVFKETKTIFEFIQDIIRTNLTKFHEDRKMNVASRVLTRKNASPPDIIGMNLLTKFREDWTINVASRVKNAPPLGSHVFQAKVIIFKLIQDFIGTNLLTKFHEDRKINVSSRVLTRKNAPPPWRPYIIGMNLVTKFHEDWKINVASRLKSAPPLGSHVFQAKFHEDRKINVAMFFNQPGIILEFGQNIIGINLLTKFHIDPTINVVSRVLTRLYHSHIWKNAPPLGSHVFQANVTIFELIPDIIQTNLLTKCHEDWTINVAFNKANVDDGQKAITKAHNEQVVPR
ncbi:hypothetical protein DPMN_066548 [Dreissena polymorpha]|uniref:Uncharacterized protein n=1 Tax=Dreissena polymorpha TaxID=45954 RepID=A0A9D3YY17_DREPO|nr:hypothetical protein DPMN_066548 [Dreissena polymorpha]